MLVIYGSMLCKDCVNCREDLDRAGIAYEFRDFSESLLWLKNFLKLRDESAQFQNVKKAGAIGIPCIVTESGETLLDWSSLL